LRIRGVTKKKLARALIAHGRKISEMMVIRCLLDDDKERIPTIEAIDAISDALGIPRPVVVAESFEQAREIEAAVRFSIADADAMALAASVGRAAQVSDTEHLSAAATPINKPVDGRTTTARNAKTLVVGRSPPAVLRSKPVRRAP
jgi:hypothetical protein